MKELSLNILDIAENSIKAGASLTEILLTERGNLLTVTIRDDGCGMDEHTAAGAADPFYTTRTTRRVGMGLPLFKLEAEQTGGTFSLASRWGAEYPTDHGTTVTAVFDTAHIDCPPLGDVIATVTTLIQGHPDTDFLYRHECGEAAVELDTRELRAVLGDVPLNMYDVIVWIRESLTEQYQQINELK